MNILNGVINSSDKFDFTMCNPPFFGDKFERTSRNSSICPISETEDITQGGESGFVERYMQESVDYQHQVIWFTCMFGKRSTFEYAQTYLKVFIADQTSALIIIAKGQIELGKTKRWLLAWRFLLID